MANRGYRMHLTKGPKFTLCGRPLWTGYGTDDPQSVDCKLCRKKAGLPPVKEPTHAE